MRKYGTVIAMLVLVVFVLATASSCHIADKLKARDRLNKGVAAYAGKRYPEAIRYFEEARQMDPNLVTADVYLATTYRTMYIPGAQSKENLDRANKAIEIFQEVLKKDPKNITALASIARTYTDLENHEEAKKWYRKRLEADPSNPEPLYGIGSTNFNLVYSKTGVTGEGVRNMSPEERAEAMRLVDEGIDALKKALQMKPDYADAAQFLNLTYREKAKLSTDPAEKEQWNKEADKLALSAMEMKKKQQQEEEKARKAMGKVTITKKS
ncbi:MAG TPA: tetratricopeptide repeat protein [Acidobacteriota bacterium]|jgi:tetratricopeptide (TPR) repeat protein